MASKVDPVALIDWAKRDPLPSRVGTVLDLYRNYLMLIAQTRINVKLRVRIDVSDIVQETFLDAHRGFENFQGKTEAELISWLRKILMRNILDQARRHKALRRDINREQSIEAAMDNSNGRLVQAMANLSTPSAHASKRKQAVLVADAIAKLSDVQRQVIVARQFSRQSFLEIGQLIGKSEDAARMIWLRALEKLKRLLES